jgi:putative endonuclease
MHEVYIIQSKLDKSYYIGEAPFAEERLIFHNKGKQRYTKARMPWKLVYKEKYLNRHEALFREKEIKGKKSRKYIEWLIENKNRGIAPTDVGTPGP